MKRLSGGQRRLVAEFLSNIGVAWFAAGVINSFLARPASWLEIVISFMWGITFSSAFLQAGLLLTKGVKI